MAREGRPRLPGEEVSLEVGLQKFRFGRGQRRLAGGHGQGLWETLVLRRQDAEAVSFVDGRLDLREEQEARIELGEAVELHDSTQEQRSVALAPLIG